MSRRWTHDSHEKSAARRAEQLTPETPLGNLKILIGVMQFDENGRKITSETAPYISAPKEGRAK